MNKDAKIFVAGHHGLVGSAICRSLARAGYDNLVLRKSGELDLTDQSATRDFFAQQEIDYVFLAAAKVGGIQANNRYRAQFLYENLMIQNNVIHSAYLFGVKKLLFLGSSCIYPKMAPQPIKEDYLLTGALETTNEPYAVAKIAGLKLCDAYRSQYGCNFISAMPTNLYGPNDRYDLNDSHVLPALVRKFHEAKIAGRHFVEIWGSGTPMREFLHVDDLADACLFLMNHYEEAGWINIGTGEDISIADLARLIQGIVGYSGKIRFDPDKPDGTPRKLLDVSRIHAAGWTHKIELSEGIESVYREKQETGFQPISTHP
ncbi:MAG: GDP-L-fucose synthase family protein [Gammaproteobacteria bacterium]